MLFKEIYGQSDIKNSFIKAVKDNRLAHAILLHGPQGTGKLALAIALIQYLNCTNRREDDSCGECPSCKKFAKLTHPDLHFAFPITRSDDSTTCDKYLPQWRERVNRSPYFNIEQWESLISKDNKRAIIYTNESNEILKKLSAKAYESEYKAMIIWLPEKMQENCANKLLKVIEEPPEKTVFILVSEEPEKVLTTVTSRTQRFFVPPLTDSVIADALQHPSQDTPQGVAQLSEDELADLAHVANGSIIKANEFLTASEETSRHFNSFVNIMRLSYSRDVRGMKKWCEEMAKSNRKTQLSFLAYMQRMIRENFIYNLKRKELNYETKPEQEFSVRFAPFISEKNICGFLTELESAERHIEQNVYSEAVFFDLALKMTRHIKLR